MAKSTVILWKRVFSLTKSSNESKRRTVSHTLTIPEIIERIFNFLPGNDIKSCRRVCRMWNSVAEAFMRQNYTIHFRRNSGLKATQTVNHGFDVFRQASSSSLEIRFSSFKLSGNNWPIKEFANLIRDQKPNIAEISLEEILLKDGKDLPPSLLVTQYELTPLFSGSLITKLHLSRSDPRSWSLGVAGPFTNFTICLDGLPSLKDLLLRHCSVEVSSNTTRRPNPIKIQLDCVTFLQKGILLKGYRLKQCIDFNGAKYVHIQFDSLFDNNSILDLEEECFIQTLSLSEPICNWITTKCRVNTLKLKNENFLEKTNMHFKELDFDMKGCGLLRYKIDLNKLPTTLQKLTLDSVSQFSEIFYSQPINLPNLKALHLINAEDPLDEELFAPFLGCSALAELKIEFIEGKGRQPTINLNWLPKNLRKLAIKGSEKLAGNICVQKLILTVCSLNDVAEVLRKISPEILIVRSGVEKPGFSVETEIVEMVSNINIPLIMGPFLWNGVNLKTSCLAAIVSNEAKYYLFENGMGKVLPLKEFRQFSE